MLFHGSHLAIEEYLIPRSSHVINGEEAVFASTDLDFALQFAGRKWNDNDINSGIHNGNLYLVEMKPKNFKKIFGTDGYIYFLSSSGFRKDRRLGMPMERINYDPVKITARIYIPNVLQSLKRSKNILISYEDSRSFKWDR